MNLQDQVNDMATLHSAVFDSLKVGNAISDSESTFKTILISILC